MGMTPTVQKEIRECCVSFLGIVVLGGLGILVLYGVTFYFQNPAFKRWVHKVIGRDDEKTD